MALRRKRESIASSWPSKSKSEEENQRARKSGSVAWRQQRSKRISEMAKQIINQEINVIMKRREAKMASWRRSGGSRNRKSAWQKKKKKKKSENNQAAWRGNKAK